jgi:hypothetical protein
MRGGAARQAPPPPFPLRAARRPARLGDPSDDGHGAQGGAAGEEEQDDARHQQPRRQRAWGLGGDGRGDGGRKGGAGTVRVR